MFRKVIKVFLGSPSDLGEERKAAKLIVDEENGNHANNLKYHVELVGWEDTVSQYGRAQDLINVDLDQCDYFVGLMWRKWGTPPGPEGHPYSSGFEEEYRRSVDRYKETDKPQISLLFKHIDKDDQVDAGKQLMKVLEFRQKIIDEKEQFFQEFSDLRDFERRFRAIIAKLLRDQQVEDNEHDTRDPTKPRTHEGQKSAQSTKDASQPIFEEGARTFLDEFVAKEGDGDDAYSAFEAARFRLLACTVSRPGNDGMAMGVHDANLIYRNLDEITLTSRERGGLILAGLENFKHKTVPIWHWIFSHTKKPREVLPTRTLFGEAEVRRNTFQLLAKLSIAPKDFDGPLEPEVYPSLWFNNDASDDVVIAALEYLGAMGDEGLGIDWEKFLTNSETNIAQAAVRAKARIISRVSVAEAFEFVAAYDNVDLGAKLSLDLMSNVSALQTEVLLSCLGNRTVILVRALAKALYDRSALTKEFARKLSEHSDAEIRLVGVLALRQHRPDLPLDQARKLLLTSPKSSPLTGFSPFLGNDHAGQRAFERYEIQVLAEKSYGTLEELREDDTLYNNQVTLAAFSAYFSRHKTELRKHLVTGFESFFSSKYERMNEASTQSNLPVYDVEQKNFLQSAFEIFCAKAGKADRAIARQVLDRFDVKFSYEIADYFVKYGGWEDVVRLVRLSENQKLNGFGPSSLLMRDDSKQYHHTAKAVLKLGSKRIADTWNLELSSSIRRDFVAEMPKRLFSSFDEKQIIEMLRFKADAVREAVALKAVQCLDKVRLRSLLDAYCNGEEDYYYNVVFWLDLGVSADRLTSRSIVSEELAP